MTEELAGPRPEVAAARRVIGDHEVLGGACLGIEPGTLLGLRGPNDPPDRSRLWRERSRLRLHRADVEPSSRAPAAKALALGASVTAMALALLRAASRSVEAVVREIELYRVALTTAMFLTGCADVASLRRLLRSN